MRAKNRALVPALLGWIVALSYLPGWGQEVPPLGLENPAHLAPFDPEFEVWLRQADELLAEGNYPEAIRSYQALVVQGQRVAYPSGPSRFISYSRVASERISALPSEAMSLYRQLYDPQARGLYEQAMSDSDMVLLRRIVLEYGNTSVAADALELLGQLEFDRGRFYQAGRSWQQALTMARPDRRGGLLAKAAAAWHFAGVESLRDKRLEELRAEYGDLEVDWGGRRRNLVRYVSEICQIDMPVEAEGAGEQWTSLAGSADGLVVMRDGEVTLLPRWSEGAVEGEEIAGMFWDVQRGPRAVVEVRDGRVVAKLPNMKEEVVVPSVTHPVVVAGQVIVRGQDEVVSRDLLSGAVRWRSLPLPMVRRVKREAGYGYYTPIMDSGRYALTVGGGMVYAVTDFPHFAEVYRSDGAELPASDGTSRLAALSLAAEGKLAWQVGGGLGDDEVVRSGRFLGPPTYADGRLYAMLRHRGGYYIACLESSSGGLLWKTLVGEMPLLYGRSLPLQMMADRASSPAVREGRVFVTTNAGVVGAYDAESGSLLWVHQYGRHEGYQLEFRVGVQPPGNPVLALGDVVVVLPADGSRLMGLRAGDGELLWSAGRAGQMDLTAVSASRVLMSGPGLVLVDAVTGKTVWQADGRHEIHGRPAVTEGGILASGKGCVVRAELRGGDVAGVRTEALRHEGAVLGNLVMMGGKLVAAGPGVVSVFMGYEEARESIGRELEGASGGRLARLLVERGELAVRAGDWLAAIADLSRALEQGAGEHAERARRGLYEANAALALRTAGEDGQRYLREAERNAQGQAEKGELLTVRMALLEAAGRVKEAAAAAQQLSSEYEGVLMRDLWPAGRGREGEADRARRSGYEIGQGHVARLIREHGQQAYAEFDILAEQWLRAANRGNDGQSLMQARRLYPHSKWADDLLLAAGEVFYREGLKVRGIAREELLLEAKRALQTLDEYPGSELALSGKTGLVLVQLHVNPVVAGVVHAESFAGVPVETRVEFANFRGTVRQLLESISASAGVVR